MKERINNLLKLAMKSRNKTDIAALRSLKAAIINKEKATGSELDDVKILKVVQTLVKQRKDSLAIYVEQKREDLATIERDEITILSIFLPKQMSEEELAATIKMVISEQGATSVKDMGKVIRAARNLIGAGSDGKAISAEVKKQLS